MKTLEQLQNDVDLGNREIVNLTDEINRLDLRRKNWSVFVEETQKAIDEKKEEDETPEQRQAHEDDVDFNSWFEMSRD